MDPKQSLPFCIVAGGAEKELRLADGEDKCAGRVEVKVQEEWGTVCNNGWGMDEVSVICRQLGCPTAIKATGWANSRAGSGRIWMDHVSCRGNESALWDCKHDGWGKHNCTHQQDIGVTCSGRICESQSLDMKCFVGGNYVDGLKMKRNQFSVSHLLIYKITQSVAKRPEDA